MSGQHDSGHFGTYKTCPCGTMANSNSQRTCFTCQQDFMVGSLARRQTDGRGRITKRCTECGTAAPSNRTAVCVCGTRFQSRSSRPRLRVVRRRLAEVHDIFENPPPVRFSASLQNVSDILMQCPILFCDSDSLLTAPNDGFGEFSEFDEFFNPPLF